MVAGLGTWPGSPGGRGISPPASAQPAKAGKKLIGGIKMLKRLLENGGLFFNLEWEYDGKKYNADFEIEVEEIDEKKVQVTIDQINNRSSAICLFSEEYNLDETEQFLLDLESDELEFIINKLEEIL